MMVVCKSKTFEKRLAYLFKTGNTQYMDTGAGPCRLTGDVTDSVWQQQKGVRCVTSRGRTVPGSDGGQLYRLVTVSLIY